MDSTAEVVVNPPASILDSLRTAIGNENVLSAQSDMLVYECDGYILEKNSPDLVVFPTTSEQVAAVVKICVAAAIPFLPRGAGTSLAGGCLPVGGGVLIVMTRMKKILDISLRDRIAALQPGVVNIWLTRALVGSGFHYAPDPSSQGACTIGGNVATNAGGPHTLKYGVTANHVLGLEIVTPEGSIVQLGGPVMDPVGLDLTGVLVGSEGTLGIVTKIWVRLTPNSQACRTMLAIFDTIEAATETITEIIGAGVIPAALELMDQGILTAVEEAFHFGFPLDAGAILLIEVDGLECGVDAQRNQVEAICRRIGVREIRLAQNEAERTQLWKCRKLAFGAIGRLSPSYCTQDGVVPRTKLPQILKRILQIGKEYEIRIVNIFHAGDGNIHPVLLFDERDKEQTSRVMKASTEILEECIRLGGSVTGEHGIGVEKIHFMEKLFSKDDIQVMEQMRKSLNPKGLLSPGKLLPTAGGCSAEQVAPSRRAAL